MPAREAESAKVMSSPTSSVLVSPPVREGLTTMLPELLSALAEEVEEVAVAEAEAEEEVELFVASSFAASVAEGEGFSSGGGGAGVGSKVSRLSSCISLLASQNSFVRLRCNINTITEEKLGSSPSGLSPALLCNDC